MHRNILEDPNLKLEHNKPLEFFYFCSIYFLSGADKKDPNFWNEYEFINLELVRCRIKN